MLSKASRLIYLEHLSSMFKNSFFIQALNAIMLVFYYHLATLNFDIDAENIYFLFISITALSLLFSDFSFALTHTKQDDTVCTSLKQSYGLRNILVLITIFASALFWSFSDFCTENNYQLLLLILISQFSELMIPYYLLIIANLSIIGQMLKVLKVIPLIFMLLFYNVDLYLILSCITTVNIILLIFLFLYLRIKLKIKAYTYFFNLNASNLGSIKNYLINFLPNMCGLFINMVIPILGVTYLGKAEFNTVLLTDRFVKNFENIFQAILQWNLREINTINDKVILRYLITFIFGILIFIFLSPHLIKILLNVQFRHIENIYLQVYCTIAIMGPLITFFGFRYYVLRNRVVEYTIIVSLVGFIAILALILPNSAVPLQLALPFGYGLALLILLVRKTNSRW